MEQQGRLKSWDDDRGFGFIQPERGGAEVFAHISAMRGERRPVAGDTVAYIANKDKQGRLRAEHVRLAGVLALDQPLIRRKPQPVETARAMPGTRKLARAPAAGIQNPGIKLLVFAALCAAPLLGAAQLLVESGFIWALLAYLLASLLSFCQYWLDKASALKGRWRTPENTMHLVELLGGWPGALLAQQCFRHKTRKVAYQLPFWAIVALHQAFWIDWLLFDGAWLGGFLRGYMPG